jgi:dihydrofolate reductase
MKRKIILYVATSLDGFIARKNKKVDWLDTYNNTGEDYGYPAFYAGMGTIIIGNTTYQQFKEPYQGKKVYVFSRKNKGKKGNIQFVSGDIKKFMEDYKPEGNIWLVGGADLAHQFLEHNLIDEFIITIMPTLLGEGIPLFQGKDTEKQLKLLKTKSYKSGVMQLHYRKN